MFHISQPLGAELLSWDNLAILIPSSVEHKGIMPPQAGMPHALNPRYPSLSQLNIFEIATRTGNGTRLDLVPSFVVENPTIGDLSNACTRPTTSTPHSEPISGFSIVGSALESTEDHGSALETEEIVMVQSSVEDSSPAPSTGITLMQGRRSSGEPSFYLISDGTGSIATYVYLPPFESKMPVSGIESPYLRCPSRLTGEVSIPGAAKLIVEALMQAQPDGPFSIGEFSGRTIFSYEVCRQLAAARAIVDHLLLINMCCPRPVGVWGKTEVGWKIYKSIASHGGLWNASDMTQQHLRAIFASMAGYHPPPMTAEERPRQTAIIWGKKGLIDQCSRDIKLMQLLADRDMQSRVPMDGIDMLGRRCVCLSMQTISKCRCQATCVCFMGRR